MTTGTTDFHDAKSSFAGLAMAFLIVFGAGTSSEAQTLFTHDAAGNRVTQAAAGVPTTPVIAVPPKDQVAQLGGTARFSAVAGGPGPFTYQWFKGAAPIGGATSDTLVIPNLTAPDFTPSPAGTPKYSVQVTNAHSSVTSTAVGLYEDSLGSGLPNWWRQQYFGSLDAVNPKADADNDGVTNGQEYTDGTQPDNASSRLGRVTLVGPAGLMSKSPNRMTYAAGTAVSVSGASAGELQFGGWTGSYRAQAQTLNFNVPGTSGTAGDVTLTGLFGSMPVATTSPAPAFTNSNGTQAAVNGFATAANGQWIAFGNFDRVNGQPRPYVARFLPDGSLDSGFAPTPNGNVTGAVIQPDGKIVIAGSFTDVAGQPSPGVARFNADGTPDVSFAPVFQYNINRVVALEVQRDGKILLGGELWDGNSSYWLLRMNEDGSLDPSFDAYLNGEPTCITQQSDGKILLGGFFSRVNFTDVPRLVRLNLDGTPDPSFSPSETFAWTSGTSVVIVQPDGKVLVGGGIQMGLNDGGYLDVPVARFNADGTLDSAFTQKVFALLGYVTFADIALQTDGRIVGVGTFTLSSPSVVNAVRLNADGNVDPDSFVISRPNGPLYAVAAQGNGDVLIGGAFSDVAVEPDTGSGNVLSNPRAAFAKLVTTNHIVPQALGVSPAGPLFAANAPTTLLLPVAVNEQPVTFAVLESSADGVSFHPFSYGVPATGNNWNFPITALPPGANYFRATLTNTQRETARTHAVGPLITPPVVTSQLTAVGEVGQPFSYTGTATGALTGFTASSLPAWATASFDANSNTLRITGTPTSGVTSSISLQPANAAGSTTSTLVLTITSPFSSWQTANFTAGELLDPNISGPLGDATGAGIANLIKYALGIPPKQPGNTGLPTGDVEDYGASDYLTLVYTRDKSVQGITLVVEVSDGLTTWLSGPAHTTEVSRVSHPNNTETVTVRDNVPVTSDQKRFIRLRVNQ